jgi:hypothetical protein
LLAGLNHSTSFPTKRYVIASNYFRKLGVIDRVGHAKRRVERAFENPPPLRSITVRKQESPSGLESA